MLLIPSLIARRAAARQTSGDHDVEAVVIGQSPSIVGYAGRKLGTPMASAGVGDAVNGVAAFGAGLARPDLADPLRHADLMFPFFRPAKKLRTL